MRVCFKIHPWCISFQSFVFFVYHLISVLLKILFWVYSDGGYVSVINTFVFVKTNLFLNFFILYIELIQKIICKSSLLNIFDAIITSNKIFLLSFSFSEQLRLQMKIKNNDVLSVLVRSWYKKHFLTLHFL